MQPYWYESAGVPVPFSLPLQQFQALDNVPAHLLLGIAGGEIFPQLLPLEFQLLLLVGLCLRQHGVDYLVIQQALLRQLFQADALGVGRGAVVQRHRVQHRPLLIRVFFIEAALEWEKRSRDSQYRTTAMEYWADLRARSGMDPITEVYPEATIDQLIELCRRERRIELAFENHRFFDTRTWMIATTTDNGPIYGMNVEAQAVNTEDTPDTFWRRTVVQNRVFRANHFLYPFSQRELDRNKLLTQNYNWR